MSAAAQPGQARAHPVWGDKRVLVVGVGGLGSPAARVLARSGVGRLTLLDDDRVALSNLHRQTLFDDADVGASKAQVAARRLDMEAAAAGWRVETRACEQRARPDNLRGLLEDADLVLEGADNFATKFLVADACRLAGLPVVQAGAVRWTGWALASLARGGPCLRCVFEDIPPGREVSCAAAGVIGPVVGVLGSLQAALALELLHAQRACAPHEADARPGEAVKDATAGPSAAGWLWSYQALSGALRRRQLRPRPGCPLCSGEIQRLEPERYATCGATGAPPKPLQLTHTKRAGGEPGGTTCAR